MNDVDDGNDYDAAKTKCPSMHCNGSFLAIWPSIELVVSHQLGKIQLKISFHLCVVRVEDIFAHSVYNSLITIIWHIIGQVFFMQVSFIYR